MTRRHLDTSIALVLAALVSLVAYAACERLGLVVKPDRPPAVEAGVSR